MTDNISSAGVPAFLTKLWTLVDDPSTDEFIAWDANGDSFHVIDQSRFAKEILPLYFKHNNIASFIRQLNMYGFRKVVNIDTGALKSERDDMQFSHMYFKRNQEYLLEHIKRKVGGTRGGLSGQVSQNKTSGEGVRAMLSEVHTIQEQQEQMNSQMETMKIENEALWREVAILRQKHLKQQQVVNKLVQFLVTLVSQSQRPMSGMKRKKALMINDSSQLTVPTKKSRQISLPSQHNGSKLMQQGDGPRVTILEVPDTAVTNNTTPYQVVSPPQDSVLTETLPFSETYPSTMDPATVTIPVASSNPHSTSTDQSEINPVDDINSIPVLQDEEFPLPPQTVEIKVLDPATNTATVPVASIPVTMATAVTTTSAAPPSLSSALSLATTSTTAGASAVSNNRGDMEDYVDKLQTDLESIKDLLAGNKYNLDASTLFGLFTPDAPLPATPDALLNSVKSDGSSQSNPLMMPSAGNELVQYAPLDISSLLTDADFLTDISDDVSVTNDALLTPTLEVTSDLAKRRQQKNTDSVTSDDID